MTSFMGSMANGNFPTGRQIAEDPLEKVHLMFLKWTLNVNKYTSNATMWGDTGRYPLAIELSSQVYGYLERLEKLHSNNSPSLVRHAYAEQKKTWLNMVQKPSLNKVLLIRRK